LSASVELSGAQPECAVQRAYDAADIFLHTGIIDAAGDRDGLPNVIPEAMSRGVCVITSPGGGAAEAIAHEVTGLTADPANPVALADAIVRLLSDASLRAKLRAHAHRWVAENFLAAANTARLASAFRAQAASGR
jgi:glycosyltransferase involved in cell wall biosynthesis